MCDRYLAQIAIDRTVAPRQFVYLLTLNTHLPLSPSHIPLDLQRLCEMEHTGPFACQLLSQQGALLADVATYLVNGKGQPFVVIVGDHSPPFNRKAERASFDQQKVPLYLLSPVAGLSTGATAQAISSL